MHIESLLRKKTLAILEDISHYVLVMQAKLQANALASVQKSDEDYGTTNPGNMADEGGTPALSTENLLDHYHIASAIHHLRMHARERASGHSASHVKAAIQAGGLSLPDAPRLAKHYDPYLVSKGFLKLTPASLMNFRPIRGDVAVIQPYDGGDLSGHIMMYDGGQWISDFRQADFWPDANYRKYAPPYSIFRAF